MKKEDWRLIVKRKCIVDGSSPDKRTREILGSSSIKAY